MSLYAILWDFHGALSWMSTILDHCEMMWPCEAKKEKGMRKEREEKEEMRTPEKLLEKVLPPPALQFRDEERFWDFVHFFVYFFACFAISPKPLWIAGKSGKGKEKVESKALLHAMCVCARKTPKCKPCSSALAAYHERSHPKFDNLNQLMIVTAMKRTKKNKRGVPSGRQEISL